MPSLLTTSMVLLLSIPCTAVLADEAPSGPPAEGERIRLKAPAVAGRAITGRLLRAGPSALVVTRDDGSVVDVPRSAIQELEVARGRTSRAKTGAVIGGAAGAGAIVAAYAADGGGCHSDARCVIYPIVLGAASISIGAVVGRAIGEMVGTDRWVKVDPARVKVALAPTGRGVAFAVSVGF